MKDWMDFDGDGDFDIVDMLIAEDLLSNNDDEDNDEFEDTFEDELIAAGLDPIELEFMDPEERAEVLEDAGLDPDDYDYY